MGWKRTRQKKKLKSELYANRPHCFHCGIAYPAQFLTFDHLIRKRDGGHFISGNIVLSCWLCNQLREPHTNLPRAARIFSEMWVGERTHWGQQVSSAYRRTKTPPFLMTIPPHTVANLSPLLTGASDRPELA